jgi:hypothetical protein
LGNPVRLVWRDAYSGTGGKGIVYLDSAIMIIHAQYLLDDHWEAKHLGMGRARN